MTDSSLVEKFQKPANGKASVEQMAQLFQELNSGRLFSDSVSAPNVISEVIGNATAASGTFTLATVIATDEVVINGVTFACVASGATGNQFNVGGSDTITAANLAAAINASVTALVAGVVTATSAAAVVTVSAVETGLTGNAITISSPDATITASGARLTGGAVDTGLTTYSF